MNKIIIILSLSILSIVAGCQSQSPQVVQLSNVNNNQQYQYVITDIQDNKIYGLAINKTQDGQKILLYRDEVPYANVSIGDTITLEWNGTENDIDVVNLESNNDYKWLAYAETI
ncbi:hypothetical protein [Paraliobacillus ryukyuensis]|uniref:hypothetical protein n=1 Tax=Paraliobacillus ryukyuensis TaxID=200904 RepID=UPI0009A5BE9F|nr:hypothetical protein [Paraliobacillus ryukyuensis]